MQQSSLNLKTNGFYVLFSSNWVENQTTEKTMKRMRGSISQYYMGYRYIALGAIYNLETYF